MATEYKKLQINLTMLQAQFEAELEEIEKDIMKLQADDVDLHRLPGLQKDLIETRRNLIKLKVMMEDL